jgi:hypothetical protein
VCQCLCVRFRAPLQRRGRGGGGVKKERRVRGEGRRLEERRGAGRGRLEERVKEVAEDRRVKPH